MQIKPEQPLKGEEKKLTDKLGNLVFDLQSPEAR